ncbi:MAG: aspartate--tRNA ligase [Oscillospiraceae bacterium]|jgi:aspartyl-tRNA synthetase|nr:aspartate--tRNA ligase [Oscillospiraceae bacterium]
MDFKRTDYCGNIFSKKIGEKVTVCGWVQKQRDLGKLIFVDLRDRTGVVQLAFYEKNPKVFEQAFRLRAEFVVAASGFVCERSSKNPNIPTGDIEIEVEQLRVYSKAQTPPFEIVENSNAGEELRLKFRYLDLRRSDLSKNILIRHKMAKLARDYFNDNGFIEIETPFLIKSTPEGARDYLVPSRAFRGKFFALPQSPQLYKQLAMIAGFDRYMQIVKCFRDEDLRADRQPEFTQIDLEMSFVNSKDIMSMVEGFIVKLYKNIFNKDIAKPFFQMNYDDCMKKFGSDKPDLRFGMEIIHLTKLLKNTEFRVFSDIIKNKGLVCAINAKGACDKFSRKDIDKLSGWIVAHGVRAISFTKSDKNKNSSSSYEKFLSTEEVKNIRETSSFEPGDILFLVAHKNELTCLEAIGALRVKVAQIIDIKKSEISLLWVTNFPLFEYDKNQSTLIAKHHPFVAPKDEDLKFLETNPEKVRAEAFDLILNGNEIGGGSIRICDFNVQKRVLGCLGFSDEETKERFGFLLDAMQFGAPPHGGLALGFDRLIMILLGCENIREVIAFPKISTSSELMTSSPSVVCDDQLNELGIKLDKLENTN